jgi:hypothetical protein
MVIAGQPGTDLFVVLGMNYKQHRKVKYVSEVAGFGA